MLQPSASPSLIVHSTARSFGTGNAPGCARQTGQVCVFGSPPDPFSQGQNIFVPVFSWTGISSPMTGSQFESGIGKELLRLQQRDLDVAAHLVDGEYSASAPCMRIRQSSFSPASSERRTSSI